jgi:PPOX class probable F420-dependent enzyme
MPGLPTSVRQFIESGPLAHVVTLGPGGDPHVSMAWVGLDGDEVVIGTLPDQPKLRNLRADPRIALSFQAHGRNAFGLDNYLVLRGTARVTEGGAAALLQRLAHVYLGPDVVFPPFPNPPPGYVIRVSVEKVSGIGDWSA